MLKITEGYLKFEQAVFMDYDEMLKDDLWQDFTKEQLYNHFRTSTESDNTNFEYYFNQQIIRIINAHSDNTFFLYDYQALLAQSFWKDNQGQMQFQSIDWHSQRINSETWHVSYSHTIDVSDRKIILGFDCFKAIVKQTRVFHNETDVKIFELYVTDEILLPAHAVAMWWNFVIPYCPIEIIEYEEGKKNQFYSKKYILSILPENIEPFLQIPNELKYLIL